MTRWKDATSGCTFGMLCRCRNSPRALAELCPASVQEIVDCHVVPPASLLRASLPWRSPPVPMQRQKRSNGDPPAPVKRAEEPEVVQPPPMQRATSPALVVPVPVQRHLRPACVSPEPAQRAMSPAVVAPASVHVATEPGAVSPEPACVSPAPECVAMTPAGVSFPADGPLREPSGVAYARARRIETPPQARNACRHVTISPVDRRPRPGVLAKISSGVALRAADLRAGRGGGALHLRVSSPGSSPLPSLRRRIPPLLRRR
jgi:hypothetical protein